MHTQCKCTRFVLLMSMCHGFLLSACFCVAVAVHASSAPLPGITLETPTIDAHVNFQELQFNFNVGVGKADITGPAGDVAMMGYAQVGQRAAGIHIRQYARAFIIDDGNKRFVFVNLDACMASQALTSEVIKQLRNEFGDTYGDANVAISGVHTHAGPGGFLQVISRLALSWQGPGDTMQKHPAHRIWAGSPVDVVAYIRTSFGITADRLFFWGLFGMLVICNSQPILVTFGYY